MSPVVKGGLKRGNKGRDCGLALSRAEALVAIERIKGNKKAASKMSG